MSFTRLKSSSSKDGIPFGPFQKLTPKNIPLKQLTIHSDSLDYYDPDGSQIIARQQLTPVYHRNGVAYVMTRACLLEKHSIMGEKNGALILYEHLVSIDTIWDLQLAEFIQKNL